MSKKYTTNFLEDTNGSTGTTNQVLVSTATGVDWVDASTVIGGPYLPLAGGTLTGGLVGTTGNFSGAVNALYFRTAAANSEYSLLTRDSTGNALFVQNAQSGTDQNIAIFQYGSAAVNQGTTVLQVAKDKSYFANCNVGIGTTSPGAKLDIGGDVRTSTRYLITTGAANQSMAIGYWDGVNARVEAGSALPMLITSYQGNIKLGINGGTTMTIQSSNVGIGATSPSDRLQVSGVISATTNDTAYGQGYFAKLSSGYSANTLILTSKTGDVFQATNFGRDIALLTGDPTSEKMRITSAGNVGIGTTSPSARLTVQTAADAQAINIIGRSDGLGYLQFFGSNGTTLNGSINGATTGLGFSTSSGQKMTILSGGNVGIGTTSPSYKLQVGDNGVGDGNITMKANGNGVNAGAKLTFNMNVGGGNADSYIAQIVPISYDSLSSGPHNSLNFKVGTWNNNADAGVSRMTILSNGNIGIGTTDPDTARLAVIGGNVGIGTTNPGAKLTVQGDDSINAFKITDSGDGDGFKATSHTTQGTYVQIYNAAHTQTIMLDGRSDNTARHTYFNGGGNVGIGTTSPAARLEVRSDGAVAEGAEIRLQHANNNTNDVVSTVNFANNAGSIGMIQAGTAGANNTGYIALFTDIAGASSERMRVHTNGNVGIGTTSPGAKFTTSGVIMAIANDNAYNAGYFAKLSSDHGANSLRLTSRTGDVFLASDYGTTVTLQVGNPNVPALYINANKRVQFNGYDSTNQTGTPTYLLGTDASGNIVKTNTVPGSAAGPYLPLAGGTLTGGLIGTSAGFTQGIDNNVNGLRLLNPGGGSSTGQVGAQSGAIKITLPVSWTNTMMRMTIKVYEYTTNESFTIVCGGYNYSSGTAWYNHFAYIESSAKNDRNFTVRFGHDGTKCCVYIGELASTWTYPQVFVTEFEAGYSGTSASTWRTGWDVGFETSAFGTITQTETNTQINNWARNGQNTYFSPGSGNVGIGTTSPSAKLEVNGAVFVGNHTGTVTPTNGIWIEGADGTETQIQMYSLNGSVFHVKNAATKATIGYASSQNRSVNFTNTGAGNISVGIGTDSPLTELEVVGTARMDTGITESIHYVGTGVEHWGDGGTGMSFPANDVISFKTTSSDRLYINSTGNVGIGTTSPGTKLHVGTGSGATVDTGYQLAVDSAGIAGIQILAATNQSSRVVFGDSDDNDVGMLRYDHTDNSMRFITNGSGSERMRITSSGNVGIGTTNPGYKLEVNNTSAGNLTTALTLNNGSTTTNTAVALRLQTDPTSTVNSYSEIRSTRTNSPAAGGVAMQFLVTNSTTGAASEIMRLSYAGLGLGTAGTTTITDTRRGAFADGTAAAPAYSFSDDTNNGMYRITTDTLGFSTAGSEKLRISSAGNVGIGTTNPSEKLDVNGNLIVSGNFNNLYVGGKTDSNVDGIRMLCAGDDSFIDCRGGSGLNFRLDDTTGDTQRIKFHSGGNVSIGNTNNSYKLDVTGTGNFAGNLQISTGDQQTTRLLLKNTSSTGGRTFALVGGIHNVTQDGFSIYDTVAAATRLAILNTGNVGIGNTNDTYKLDVSGTGRFTSTVTATNFILSSDKTLKDNISDINTDHVDVKWKNFELKSEPGVKRAGVVAQELEEKHPEFVRTDKDGIKSVAYIDLLIAKIAELEARLEKLEK